ALSTRVHCENLVDVVAALTGERCEAVADMLMGVVRDRVRHELVSRAAGDLGAKSVRLSPLPGVAAASFPGAGAWQLTVVCTLRDLDKGTGLHYTATDEERIAPAAGLADAIGTALAEAGPLLAAQGMTIIRRGVGEPRIAVEQAEVTAVLRGILEYLARHAPAKTAIDLLLDATNGKAKVIVTAPGFGLPQGVAHKLLHDAPAGSGRGPGIGRLIEREGGSLEVESGMERGLRVALTWESLSALDQRQTRQ
ncbi:sensor histidine kinase, partial [bacterium]|nr:sensor histidine kinase [candidate division CSSED10-310 bacterium]